MAMNGGQRPGAGRPMQELSRLAVRLIEAFPRGYQIAGESKGLQGDPEDVQREVIAQILADEIKAGRGINVVRLEVDFMGKVAGRSNDKASESSPLLDALSRCPGLLPGTMPSPSGNTIESKPVSAILEKPGTPHSKSDVPDNGTRLPFFNPQLPFDFDEPEG